MSHRILLATAVSASILALTSSCKTTEANYRAAYEATVSHRNALSNADDPDMTVKTDSAAILTVFLAPIQIDKKSDAVTPQKALPFNAAVNRFKQVFNAKALCLRLRDNGWPQAYVAQTDDEEFYVMAAGSDTQAEALAICAKLHKSGSSVPLGRGYPQIVKSAR